MRTREYEAKQTRLKNLIGKLITLCNRIDSRLIYNLLLDFKFLSENEVVETETPQLFRMSKRIQILNNFFADSLGEEDRMVITSIIEAVEFDIRPVALMLKSRAIFNLLAPLTPVQRMHTVKVLHLAKIHHKDVKPFQGALFAAILKNETEHVIDLLMHGVSPNIFDSKGFSPLAWACYKNNLQIVLNLLLHNACPNIAFANEWIYSLRKNGWTPLHEAAAQNNPDMVAALIIHNADVNAQDRCGRTPLYVATKAQCTKSVEHLLLAEADPNIYKNVSPLHEAVVADNHTIATLLLNAFADPDCRVNHDAKHDVTPLFAAVKNSPAMVEILLKNGADPMLYYTNTDGEKIYPHFWAVLDNKPTALELILDDLFAKENILRDAQAHPHALMLWQRTLLQVAVEENCSAGVVEVLLDYDFDPNIFPRDVSKEFLCANALQVALIKNQLHHAELLIQYGADPNAVVDDDGSTVMYTLTDASVAGLAFILANGADPDHATKKNITPLMSFAASGFQKSVSLLAPRANVLAVKEITKSEILQLLQHYWQKRGVNPDLDAATRQFFARYPSETMELTAADFAELFGHQEIAKMLREKMEKLPKRSRLEIAPALNALGTFKRPLDTFKPAAPAEVGQKRGLS